MPKRDAEYMAAQRRNILEAASKCMGRLGVRKTTMQDVAEEAGVSVGSIYVHFKDKEALYAALYEGIRLEVSEFLRSPEDGGIQRFVLPSVRAMSLKNARRFIQLVTEIIELPPDNKVVVEYGKTVGEATSVVSAELRSLAEKGEKKLECSAESIAIVFQCAVWGAVFRANLQTGSTPEEIRAAVKEVFDVLVT